MLDGRRYKTRITRPNLLTEASDSSSFARVLEITNEDNLKDGLFSLLDAWPLHLHCISQPTRDRHAVYLSIVLGYTVRKENSLLACLKCIQR